MQCFLLILRFLSPCIHFLFSLVREDPWRCGSSGYGGRGAELRKHFSSRWGPESLPFRCAYLGPLLVLLLLCAFGLFIWRGFLSPLLVAVRTSELARWPTVSEASSLNDSLLLRRSSFFSTIARWRHCSGTMKAVCTYGRRVLVSRDFALSL